MLRAAIGGMWLLCACAPGPSRLPEIEGAASVAVVVERNPRTIAIAPFGASSPALGLEILGADEHVSALYYGSEASLPYGEFSEDAASPWARALPRPMHVEARAWSDEVWQSVDPLELGPILVPQESPIACAARGGCFADAAAWSCTTPCPPPPEVAPPEAPRPPVFEPCPSGWSADPSANACRAPISGCPEGELQLPGSPACRAPGAPCVDEFAVGLDEAATRFVRAGAVGGDGTRARPFATIDAAASAAVIALARGDHAMPARVSGRFVGACAAQTRLVASTTVSLDAANIEAASIAAPALRTRGVVRLAGVATVGRLVVEAGSLELIDVAARGALVVHGPSTLVARDVSVDLDGATLELAPTSSATLERAQIQGSVRVDGGSLTVSNATLRARGRAALEIQDAAVVLRQIDLEATGAGAAVDVQGLATLELGRAWISAEQDVVRLGEGSRGSLVDVSARGGGGMDRVCIGGTDTRLILERVQLDRCGGNTVQIRGPGSEVTIHDFVSTSGGPVTGAFELGARPPIVLRRARVQGSGIVRMLVNASTYPWGLELADLTLRGGSLRVRDEGRARIERLHVVDGVGSGIQTEIATDTPIVEASDVRVEGLRVAPGCENRGCIGAAVLSQGSVRVDRFYFASNPGPGVQVQYSEEGSALRNGVIADQQTGVAIYGSPRDLRPLLEGVTLRNVSAVCDPCGEGSSP